MQAHKAGERRKGGQISLSLFKERFINLTSIVRLIDKKKRREYFLKTFTLANAILALALLATLVASLLTPTMWCSQIGGGSSEISQPSQCKEGYSQEKSLCIEGDQCRIVEGPDECSSFDNFVDSTIYQHIYVDYFTNTPVIFSLLLFIAVLVNIIYLIFLLVIKDASLHLTSAIVGVSMIYLFFLGSQMDSNCLSSLSPLLVLVMGLIHSGALLILSFLGLNKEPQRKAKK